MGLPTRSVVRPTLIWLDRSSPRLQVFRMGLGMGPVNDRPHPKAASQEGDSPLQLHFLLRCFQVSSCGFLLERAKGTGRVGLRYDG